MKNKVEYSCDNLRILMDDIKNQELACRKYLRIARDLLIDVSTAFFFDEAEEYRGHSGDSDYIVICKALDPAGIEANKAYIWEVKAPQCYLFEYDTMNRVRPTKEFISAENQLLHYYEESKGSIQFRDEFKITHPENVKIGGLIIGSKRAWVKSTKYNENISEKLFKRALELRRMYLYGNSGIKVIIWDHIYDFLLKKVPPVQYENRLDRDFSILSPDYLVVSSSGSVINPHFSQ